MSEYRVIGIDPALTNVGLCVLESSKPGDYRVTEAQTLATRTRDALPERLWFLKTGVQEFIEENRRWGTAMVMENPLSRSGPAARAAHGKNPMTIAVLGMAVGIILEPVLHQRTFTHTAVVVSPDEWMPKVKTGNLSHIMPKQQMVRYLMGQIRFPDGVSEHVIMAAGVARYWIEQQRLRERRAG